MNKKILLVIAAVLVLVGFFKPDFSSLTNVLKPSSVVVDNTTIVAPTDESLKNKCVAVVDAFKNGGSSRYKDAKRLGDLYVDLATLIELEGDNTVVKTTDEIRQANSLSGLMLRMNIKGEYDNLSVATNDIIVAGIGNDNVVLNADLRKKAVESFRALAWACYQGAK